MAAQFDIFRDGERRYQLRTKSTAFALEFDTDEEVNVFESLVCAADKDAFCWDVFIGNLPEEKRYIAIDLRRGLEDEGVDFSVVSRREVRSAETTLCVLGASRLTEAIVHAAQLIPFKEVVSFCLASDADIGCMEDVLTRADFAIVDAHRWSPYHVERINELCIQRGTPWLYVEGVRGDDISFGPIFWGRKLGCYNCLKSREHSHLQDLASQQSYEEHLKSDRNAAQSDLVFLESLRVRMIADFVLLEVLKFIESFEVPSVWRTVVDINVNTLEVRKSHLLKHPYCTVCNPRVEYNPAPWLEEITLRRRGGEE